MSTMSKTEMENALREAVRKHAGSELKIRDQLNAKLTAERKKREACAQRVSVIDQAIMDLKPKISEAIGGQKENLRSLGEERTKLQAEKDLLLAAMDGFDDIIVAIEKEIAEAKVAMRNKVSKAFVEQKQIHERTLNVHLREIETQTKDWMAACQSVGSEINMFADISYYGMLALKNNWLWNILYSQVTVD